MPEALAVVVAVAKPVRFTVAPLPPAPLMVPERVYVGWIERISTMLRLYLSVSGSVSLMVTVVPVAGVTASRPCTHIAAFLVPACLIRI